jgi:stage III sporulation protein AG
MEVEQWTKKLSSYIKKYRYFIVIVLVGLLILTLPSNRITEDDHVIMTDVPKQVDLKQQITDILRMIEGVGKVEVMLTERAGEVTHYQRDEDQNGSSDSSSVRQDTVILTDAERNEHPLITQVIPAEYLGAVIVCQGADRPAVKWAIVEAVSKLTGLGADQISVLKMK